MVMAREDDNWLNPPAGILATGVALTTLALTVVGNWLQEPIEIPVGVLFALMVLILIPTGDVMRLISKWVEHLTPNDDDDRFDYKK